jgi:hypothetical protein
MIELIEHTNFVRIRIRSQALQNRIETILNSRHTHTHTYTFLIYRLYIW